ncbi:zinc-binding dehydrogenase [Stagonosporopsis vannaccii]|nr:zinc-binding dehydrogenase [Stagonosporopsis vannaccii]
MHRSISISQAEGKPGQVYYPLCLDRVPRVAPTGTQVLVKVHAAALNHRDLFIRQHLYPNVAFGITQWADGCGTVVETGHDADVKWKGKRVILSPAIGWDSDPFAPEVEGTYALLGGTHRYKNGTLQEYITIDQSQLENAPSHLSDIEAAAFPVTGLTAWRAVMLKCEHHIGAGKKVLITGIGGGVALMALEFAKSVGSEVYVTSGNEWKLEQARRLGAAGGVNYREKAWEKRLLELTKSAKLDAIIDGAGGDIVEKSIKILKPGGIISVYGMTLAPHLPFLMQAVMRNIEVKGSTMGSRKEFGEMIRFIEEKKIRPVVSRVVKGLDLDAIDGLYDDMKKGTQFGKLVVEMSQTAPRSAL